MRKLRKNPFYPQFGKRPDNFIGREQLINHLLDELYTINSPYRTTIISGVRGNGKTSILSDINLEIRKDPNWIVVNLSHTDDLMGKLVDKLAFECEKSGVAIKSLTIGAAGVGLSLEKKEANSSFKKLLELTERIKREEKQLLVLLDEISIGTDLREFISTYQLLLREGVEIALVMAGLPQNVLKVLKDDVLTFLRRSKQIFLEPIEPFSFKVEYETIFKKAGRVIEEDALDLAYLSSGGYPYMFQLIGYYIWSSEKSVIDKSIVEHAIQVSKGELYKNVYGVLIDDMGPFEQKYVLAMAKNQQPVKAADLAKTLGKEVTSISPYREKLLERGIIRASSRGFVEFILPFFGEFLLEKEKQEKLRL